MGKEYRAKVFKSGNSAAVRLPKSLGLEPGTELIVREEQGRYTLEPVAGPSDRIDLTGIYGACPGLRPVERLDIPARDLDWEGTLLKRG
ncbi:MAG: AbrB/MazE/SpoVT family DNA-binding domain-containing protein [Sphingomonas sp.]|nr:AbrB/MazE/SpoVT family DNA-binding domain-containing protein [Sphingomonas sp.]MDX3882839.1 AbrB/MazE/SpoVT family DNA-binding domain-containing protein [Sphingomonas sp.]